MAIYPYSFTLPPVNKQDIPSDGVVGEFLGISAGGVLDWLPVSGGSGTGDLLAANNLSELTPTAGTARTNLGLGTSDSPTFANLTLTSPSLSSSAPVTISQTWNAGSNVMTALKVVATDTASGGTSSLLDVQTTAGGSQFSVKKGVQIAGYTQANAYGIQSTYFRVGGFYNTSAICGNSGLYLFQSPTLESGISIGNIGLGRNAVQIRNAELTFGAANLVALAEEGAGQLALRNGAAAQTFNVYGTSSSNNTVYERMFMRYTAASTLAFQIGTEQVGATARPLQFSISGSKRLIFEATGVNDTQIYAVGNTARNILTLRSLDESGRYQFYINAAGKSELYVGTGVLISEAGSSYFNGGNVGIGTTAPSTKLEVALPLTGNVSNDGIKLSRGLGYFTLGNGTSTDNFVPLFTGKGTFPDNASSLNFQALSGSDSDLTKGVVNFNARNNAGTAAILSSQKAFVFANYATDLITVLGSGNVGIGTTSPTSKLHVAETWNNAGTAFCAIKSVITDTNSAAGSDFLELYSGTSTQPLRMDINKTGQINAYGTWTDAGNYERLAFNPADATFSAGPSITTQQAGSGVSRQLNIGTTGTADLRLATNSLWRWRVGGSTGHLLAHDDNAYDIGASGANRPRNVYAGNSVVVNSGVITSPVPAVSIAQNWNSGSQVFVAFDVSITDSVGALASCKLIQLRVLSNTVFYVNKTGAVESLYQRFGAGTPEGAVTAPIGAVFHRTDGGAGTSFYVKESGTGNTGWVGK